MPKYSGEDNCSLKFGLPLELRERFIAACQKCSEATGKRHSQAWVMKHLLTSWTETIEATSEEELADGSYDEDLEKFWEFLRTTQTGEKVAVVTLAKLDDAVVHAMNYGTAEDGIVINPGALARHFGFEVPG